MGEKVLILLRLPTGEKIASESRVKWVRPVNATSNEIGVEISAISMEEQNRYLLFVCDLRYDRLQSLRLL